MCQSWSDRLLVWIYVTREGPMWHEWDLYDVSEAINVGDIYSLSLSLQSPLLLLSRGLCVTNPWSGQYLCGSTLRQRPQGAGHLQKTTAMTTPAGVNTLADCNTRVAPSRVNTLAECNTGVSTVLRLGLDATLVWLSLVLTPWARCNTGVTQSGVNNLGWLQHCCYCVTLVPEIICQK